MSFDSRVTALRKTIFVFLVNICTGEAVCLTDTKWLCGNRLFLALLGSCTLLTLNVIIVILIVSRFCIPHSIDVALLKGSP